MKSHTQRTLLVGFLSSIGVCGLVGVYCLLIGSFGAVHAKVLGTTATVASASILGLASAVPWERRRWHPVGPLGAISVAVALVLVVTAIWMESWLWNQGVLRRFLRIMGTACVAGVAFPHVGLISLARLRRAYEWVRLGTLLTVAVLAIQISVTIWVEPMGDLWVRCIGVVSIAVACGTIAVPILHRVSRIRLREAVKTVELALAATCPRCDFAQRFLVGRSACVKCGLRFLIEIEEESCGTCGYPLYQLTSATCPECGTPIIPFPRRDDGVARVSGEPSDRTTGSAS
ncbi:MAG: hypothetical protein HOP29_09350 [Phycisphaerales bacterium]|nr:hypothetical protein [Phycisphaerales bacterium]